MKATPDRSRLLENEMQYRIEEAPEGSGWILMREGEGPQTVATFQPDEERTARVAAVLLNAREAGAPAPRAPQPAGTQNQPRPAPYGWDSTKTPAPRAVAPSQDDDGPTEYAAGGATVTVWPSGWAYVRFAAKPAAHVLESLRASGARWLGARKGWRLQADDLPAPFGARPEVLR
jgi:hypothetical protein